MRTGLASIAAARWALWRPPIAWKKTAPRATTSRSTSSSSVSAGLSTVDPSSRGCGVPTEPSLDRERSRARSLLEQDRVWCAYALADLEPPFVERTGWHVGDQGLVMVYRGLTPPWLFAHGEPAEGGRLVGAFLGQGLNTIVLNVAMANDSALGLYRGLGFWPFCGYYEGVGELLAA